ncbi:hypothetical protein GGQ84_001141 [Desulfitispora alkaliphila]
MLKVATICLTVGLIIALLYQINLGVEVVVEAYNTTNFYGLPIENY